MPANALVWPRTMVSLSPPHEGARTVSEADYVPRLTRILAAMPVQDRVLFFTADDRAPYGRVVAALDGAKSAGAKVLGLMTAP